MELFAKLLLKHIYRFGFTRVVNQETVVWGQCSVYDASGYFQLTGFVLWQRAYNEALPFQEIPPKLADLARRLAKPAMENEDFKAEAAIVNFYGPGMCWYL